MWVNIQRITRAPHCANVVWPDLAQPRRPVQSQPAVLRSPGLRSRARGSWRRLTRPRAALCLREWETPIDDHDGDPFHPRLPALLGDTASQRAIEVHCRAIETQDPCRPCLTHIFASPVRRFRQHGHTLPPECGLPRERLPLLLPGCIGIQGKDQCQISRTQSQRQPCTPKIATTRATPAARSASASKAPSHTHSGPAPACNAAALK